MRNLIMFKAPSYNPSSVPTCNKNGCNYLTTGPPSIGLNGFANIQHRNNKIQTATGAQPPSFYPSTQGYTGYLNERKTFKADAGGGQAYHDASEYTRLRKITAVGKSSYKVGLPSNAPHSYGYVDRSFVATARQRVRSGGCTAPKKKGALNNPSSTGIGPSVTGGKGFNRTINVPKF